MSKEQALHEDNTMGEKQELQPELMSIMKEEVGKAKERRMPIIRAFEAIARRSGLKANTIRNYYYRYLHTQEEKQEDDTISDEKDPNQEDVIGKPFDAKEKKELIREMLIAQAQGESVRGCANRLSQGDKRVLIRYQNKYRSVIAREPEYVSHLMREIEAEGIACFNPYTRARLIRSGKTPVTAEGANGQLIDWIGQFVSNVKSVHGVSLDELIKGLRDLSGLAAGNRRSGNGKSHSRELQDLNNRILMLEVSLDKERREADHVRRQLLDLTDVNQRFLSLSDTDKLSGLQNYVAKLQSCITQD